MPLAAATLNTALDPGATKPAMDVSPVKQQIRFCAAHDGVQLAYATSGRGTPLVKTSNWLSHFEFDLGNPV